ncbi:unnamed protein product [Lactuca virosa]|uniref:Uncharacterized protein n=1 Tax=Lactuca virosa TaxID=75947 RepID=A0AAU9PI51_9ASTR|nr:unnamed protein product [Lactuca virosa]
MQIKPRKGAEGQRKLPRKTLRKKELQRIRNLPLKSERLLLLLLLHQSEGSNPLEGESLPLLLHLRVKEKFLIAILSRRFALRRIPMFVIQKMSPFALKNQNLFTLRKENRFTTNHLFALRPHLRLVR